MRTFSLLAMAALIAALLSSCGSATERGIADSGRIKAQFTAKVIAVGQNVVGKVPPRPRRVHPTAGALQLDTIASQLLQLDVKVPGTLPKIKTGDRIAFTFGDKSKLFGKDDPAGKTYRF